MAYDHKVVGSNPCTVYWMDVRVINKMEIKIAKWGTPKKYFKNYKK
jgi:hypothetical protein